MTSVCDGVAIALRGGPDEHHLCTAVGMERVASRPVPLACNIYLRHFSSAERDCSCAQFQCVRVIGRRKGEFREQQLTHGGV